MYDKQSYDFYGRILKNQDWRECRYKGGLSCFLYLTIRKNGKDEYNDANVYFLEKRMLCDAKEFSTLIIDYTYFNLLVELISNFQMILNSLNIIGNVCLHHNFEKIQKSTILYQGCIQIATRHVCIWFQVKHTYVE